MRLSRLDPSAQIASSSLEATHEVEALAPKAERDDAYDGEAQKRTADSSARPAHGKRRTSTWLDVQRASPEDGSGALLESIVAAAKGLGPNARRIAQAHVGELTAAIQAMDPQTRAAIRKNVHADLAALLERFSDSETLESVLADRALPVELRATAAVHLSPVQRKRLYETLALHHSNIAKYEWRDLIFAATSLKRLDVLDSLLTSNATKKERHDLVRAISKTFRQTAVTNADLDHLLEALTGPRPPVQAPPVLEHDAPREDDPRSRLEALGVPLAKATDAGIQTIAPWIPELEALFRHCSKMSLVVDSIFDARDCAKLAKTAKAVTALMEQIVEGDWPSKRYEGARARRLLRGLDKDQISAWRTRIVRSFPLASWSAIDARIGEVAERLRSTPKLAGLSFTPSHLAELEAKRAELVGALAAAKDDPEANRRLGRELAALRNELGLVHLVVANRPSPSTVEAIESVAESIRDALSAARRNSIAEPIAELEAIQRAIKDGVAHKTTNIEVHDADDLHAFLGVYEGESCLKAGAGSSSGLVSYLGNANTRQLLAYQGGTLRARALMFVRPIRTETYEGPALQLEFPLSPTRGQAPLEPSMALFRTGLAKATAMGIPFVLEKEFLDYAVEKADILKLAPGEHVEAVMTVDPGIAPVTYLQWEKLFFIGDRSLKLEKALYFVKPAIA